MCTSLPPSPNLSFCTQSHPSLNWVPCQRYQEGRLKRCFYNKYLVNFTTIVTRAVKLVLCRRYNIEVNKK